jgi:RimJ/RimL family protein N-acetyltransferase
MTLSLSSIEQNPKLATHSLDLGIDESFTFRPLEQTDVHALASFLMSMSAQTRAMSTFDGYDAATAKQLCQAINKYDKLRFVVEDNNSSTGQNIIGLIEFSFDIPKADIERYEQIGIELTTTDCRFGPTIADAYQGRGLGSRLFPIIKDIARQFGKKRIILWGGVLQANTRAIHYYEKHGFMHAATFTNSDGATVIDMIQNL